MNSEHHFPNTPSHVNEAPALVSTCREGSPLIHATNHTVQVGLTPAAAAELLKVLQGRSVLPYECDSLVNGLRSVALSALAES